MWSAGEIVRILVVLLIFGKKWGGSLLFLRHLQNHKLKQVFDLSLCNSSIWLVFHSAISGYYFQIVQFDYVGIVNLSALICYCLQPYHSFWGRVWSRGHIVPITIDCWCLVFVPTLSCPLIRGLSLCCIWCSVLKTLQWLSECEANLKVYLIEPKNTIQYKFTYLWRKLE